MGDVQYNEKSVTDTQLTRCPICQQQLGSARMLTNHLYKIHIKDGVNDHKCHSCEFSTNIGLHLEKHVQDVHGGEFEDTANSKEDDKNINEKKGASEETTVSDKKCLHCDYCSSSAKSLMKHVMEMHMASIKASKDKCNTAVPSKGLSHHAKTADKKIRDKSCPHCVYATSYPVILARHIRTVHEKGLSHHAKTVNKKIRDKSSPHCVYATSYPLILARHIRTVHEKGDLKARKYAQCSSVVRDFGNRVKCSLCSYATSYAGNLTRHIKVIHDEVPMTGIRESKDSSGTSVPLKELSHHAKIVNKKIRDKSCPHCKYTATTLYHLTKHIQGVHEKIEDKKCPHCPYASSNSDHLTRHIKYVHTKIRISSVQIVHKF
jgi:hypothetical protein